MMKLCACRANGNQRDWYWPLRCLDDKFIFISFKYSYQAAEIGTEPLVKSVVFS
ncbi:hypothetical protein SAMN05216516_102391 [Izhakiella capsodis]|uniref:Uncharacterized protein n=1 Tax=Izhakiella capsodis TaxID=1367852 RepID=A0A1I4WAA5_9GAMM|nr:hypothetical protein SAMN05216516_102391 [Izhakiella capsodis]